MRYSFYSADAGAERLPDEEPLAVSYSDDPEAERLPDDEEPLPDFGKKDHSTSPSGISWNTKILNLCAYAFLVTLFVFVAFDQGFVALAGSEATVPVPTSTAPAPATETTPQLSAWSIAQHEASKLLSQGTSRETLSCLVPDLAKTEIVFQDALAGKYKSDSKTANAKSRAAAKVPLPALNLGMPKCGTTSQAEFFSCAGYKASHSHLMDKDLTHQGLCMRDAARSNVPPVTACTQGFDALTEMEAHSAFGIEYKNGKYYSFEHRNDCFFPQLELLEKMDEDDPNVTFLLAFRPVKDWVESVLLWNDGFGARETMECELPNLPKGVPDIDGPEDEIEAAFEHFICSHVIHIRNFIEAHPTHALIEYDLYDKETTGRILGKLFPNVKTQTDSSECWTHVSHTTDLHAGDKTVGSAFDKNKHAPSF